MTRHDDFDRPLKSWFDEATGHGARTGLLETVLDETARRRSRPAFIVALRGGRMSTTVAGSSSGARSLPRFGLRWSTALILLLVLVALVGGAILVGARLFQPSPLQTGRLGHLAYSLDGDIYVADWDGRSRVRIAHALPDDPAAGCGTFWGEGPMWSPDGRHLAYRSDCGTVYVSDPDGHPVASFPGTGWLVSWSPDSTRVATSVDLGHTFGIYGLDGVRQALLSVPLGYEVHGDYSPVWSPDGMSLLMPIAPVAPTIPSEIWELPIDGGTPRRVPDADPRSHFGAQYSHDGARMAFIDRPGSVSLVIARADGTEPRVLPGAKNDSNYGSGPGAAYQNPVVSPTGDRVAFTWSPALYDQTSDPSLSIYELRVVDVASGTVTTLARASGADHLGGIRFSPGGDRILFSRSDANYVGTSLWSVHADGSDAQLLVTGTGWGDWQWQPAGS